MKSENSPMEDYKFDINTINPKLINDKSIKNKSLFAEIIIPYVGEKILNIITCPIGREIMKDPVVTSVGQTYDRENIERWFLTGYTTDPLTREQITATLISNISVKQLIEVYNEINSYLQQSGGKRKYKKNTKKTSKNIKTKKNKSKRK